MNFKGKQKKLHKPKEPLKGHIMKTALTGKQFLRAWTSK